MTWNNLTAKYQNSNLIFFDNDKTSEKNDMQYIKLF